MSIDLIDMNRSLTKWQSIFPDGLDRKIATRMPVSKDGHLLIGAHDSKTAGNVPVSLGVKFESGRLDIELLTDPDPSTRFKGLVVVFQTVETESFSMFHGSQNAEGTAAVEVGNGNDMRPIDAEGTDSIIGTVADTTMYVLGQNSLRLILDNRR